MLHHDPSIGFANLTNYSSQRIQTPRVSSNAIKMSPNKKQLINSVQIGKTACMSEIVNIKLEDNTLFKLKMYYDSQSQHTLCNKAASQLMTKTWLSGIKIQLETIMGADNRKRRICNLKVSDKHEVEAIILDKLEINSFLMEKPKEWNKYQNEWSEEITDMYDNIEATVLLGADMATLFPINVVTKPGFIIETKTALLMRSRLTGKLIAFGHNGKGKHTVNITVTSITQDEEIENDQGITTVKSDDETDYEETDLENNTVTIPDSQPNDL